VRIQFVILSEAKDLCNLPPPPAQPPQGVFRSRPNYSLEVSMLDGFKKFVLRGNVVDMAVGIVIGAAFGGVVSSLVASLINPLIALLVGKPDFTAMSIKIGQTPFPYGVFLTALVNFVLVAAAIYFFVVTPVNALVARMNRGEKPPDPTTKKCPECLSEIPIDARRCSHCTQPVMGRAA
jgi:large conductance mechanosensitive channel